MSGPADAELRRAFQELGDHASAEGVDAERVWRAVVGEADAAERRAVVERVAGDPSWALAWRAAHGLWTAEREDADRVRATTRRSLHLVRAVLAACLVAAVGTTLLTGPGRPVHRSGAEARIESLLPEGRTLSGEEVVLRWTGPPGATYGVRMTSDDLVHVHTATALTAAEYRPPAGFLSSLPEAATVLWQVEARLADGSTVRSETFVTKIDRGSRVR